MKFSFAILLVIACCQSGFADINWNNVKFANTYEVFVEKAPAGEPNPGENVSDMSPEQQALHAHEVLLVSEERLSPGNFIACVASLISTNYVLAPASCVFSYRMDKQSGRYNQYSGLDTHVFFGVKTLAEAKLPTAVRGIVSRDNQIIKYGWNPTSYFLESDIVLMKLDKPVTLIPKVIETISLPDAQICSENLENKPVRISGWELTDEELAGNHLKSANVKVRPNQKCTIYKSFNTFYHICGVDISSNDMCRATGHGTMVYENADSKQYLVGLRSFGPGQCDVGAPTVYTRVCTFLSWIINNMEGRRHY